VRACGRRNGRGGVIVVEDGNEGQLQTWQSDT